MILYIDNASSHVEPEAIIDGKFRYLPLNTTSKLQPLNPGAKTFKIEYSRLVVRYLIARLIAAV